MTRLQSPSLPNITRLAAPKPGSFRPALSRIGAWVRSSATNNTSENTMNNSSKLLSPTALHSSSRLSSSSVASSVESGSVIAQEFAIDAGVETGVPPERDPLPAFLRQSKGDIHAKFVDLEWQQRERLHTREDAENDTPSQWARLDGDEISKRNRYYNVDPYANNRIRLRVPEGFVDYINASPIKLDVSKGNQKYFIATQGPKEGSTSHLWRMIWDETADPAVIVMLTQTYESGREKCFQYFPHDKNDSIMINQEDEFEDGFSAKLTLKSITEDAKTRSTIRELVLERPDGKTKTIWHLLFTGWPDFLIPEGDDRTALVNLVSLAQTKNAKHSDFPTVVHCSAGVGRSGTFIALDWLIDELNAGAFDHMDDEEDPILDLVDRLRQQRMMMVQGDSQFAFLYDVLKEAWLERWKAKNGGKL